MRLGAARQKLYEMDRKMNCKLILALLALPFVAQAQEKDDSVFSTETLRQVVVTGTRTPKLLSKSPVLTQVITHKDIEKADATNLRDLLQQMLPGVEFSYAMNQMVHMNFSGFGGQSVLVLVDGERLAGETMDDVDFARLNMQNIDHIEIVKSAASALYGSNSAGGVINIITKKAPRKVGLDLNGRVGKHGEQRYGVALSLGDRKWGNRIDVSRTAMDNYNVSSGPNPVSRVVSTIYGDKTWNVADKATWRPSEKWTVTGKAGYFFRQMERSADSPERYRDFSGGVRAQWQISENDHLDLSYNFDQYDKSDYQRISRLDIRDYSNVQNSFRLLYNHDFGTLGELTAGADYMHDYLFNDKLQGQTRRQDSFDAFAQFDWNVTSRIEAVGALRYDYFSDERIQRVTPKLSLRYNPLPGLNLRLGYGMGFRAPTLKERYYEFDMAGIWIVEGNPDLKAETSQNFNASVEYTRGHYNFTISGYHNSVTNKIGSGAPFSVEGEVMPRLPYINLRDYLVCGVDATAQARWSNGLTARLSYAYVHEELPEDKGGRKINNQYLPARKHSLIAHVDWDHQFTRHYGLDVGLDGRFQSHVDNLEFVDYYDIDKGVMRIHYPSYMLWKLSMAHRVGSRVVVTLAVDNLLNYKPDYYYLNCPLTDGAAFMVGVKVRLF